MGWFWADAPATSAQSQSSPSFSRPGSGPQSESRCPMHKKTIDAFNPSASGKCQKPTDSTAPPSSCPVSHDRAKVPPPPPKKSALSRLNPLNYMFGDLSNAPAPNQTMALPTEREASTIPRGSGDGNWEYPSPQQMYHALLRKGYTDTDPAAVEPMVAIHNFLNEGAWAEIVEWERRFGQGLARGWQISREGEEHAPMLLRRLEAREAHERAMAAAATTPAGQVPSTPVEPSLVRFQGRPKDMTPKAAFFQLLGWAYPEKFGTEPPFDRHDWYVRRSVNGQEKEVRYVIDYYTGPPEPTGEPVFYLDVRPAMTPTAACERLMRWGGDVWWRASGAEARHADRRG